MRLVLLRHAKAEARELWVGSDADRPCTKAGLQRLEAVCRCLHGHLGCDQLWTSPFRRARETAEVAAGVWRLPLRETAWLAAEVSSAEAMLAELSRHPLVSPCLIGHEPDLGLLVASACGGQPPEIKKSGVVILQGEPEPGGMQMVALLPPRLALAGIGIA